MFRVLELEYICVFRAFVVIEIMREREREETKIKKASVLFVSKVEPKSLSGRDSEIHITAFSIYAVKKKTQD